MSKQIKLGVSPISNTIYAGHTIKNDTIWGANKQDVTVPALLVVIEHCLNHGSEVVISSEDGEPHFSIKVSDLRKNNDQ